MTKRKNSKQHKRRVSTDSDSDPPRYEDTTDRSKMDRPVAERCAKDMVDRWKIYQNFPSYILFDAVNPTRVFKKGTVYNEADPDPFPTPNLRDTRDETDEDPDGTLQQYKPKPHIGIRRYGFDVPAPSLKKFLQWSEGETCEISYRRRRKVANKQTYQWSAWIRRKVHPQNARIIHQLLQERKHGFHDRGHESLRRMAYAGNVLEAVGQELDRDNAAGPIRAAPLKALSPILIRQLKGVPDPYGPSIKAAIAPGADLPTIVDITRFYLKDNPLDPKHVRVYRRNIIYSREALWHLAVIAGTQSVESRGDYLDSLETHDLIIEALKRAGLSKERGIPSFNEVEVNAIVRLHLEGFFDSELKRERVLPFLQAALQQRDAQSSSARSQGSITVAAQMREVPRVEGDEDESEQDDLDAEGELEGLDAEGDDQEEEMVGAVTPSNSGS
ncbi:hypothetical protein BJ322DRAFT_1020989 [Thelephora terrestris]|uniref:Uncharacterized protein n=1 Tax=Thelephora terrestris TaxID=56493 RepID=A0A9P6HG58_9AGAM|nr:hypothetical protein BJ322DRAFT_1020989 [Thelephora terrestris]